MLMEKERIVEVQPWWVGLVIGVLIAIIVFLGVKLLTKF
jgi:hypothetical protein